MLRPSAFENLASRSLASSGCIARKNKHVTILDQRENIKSQEKQIGTNGEGLGGGAELGGGRIRGGGRREARERWEVPLLAHQFLFLFKIQRFNRIPCIVILIGIEAVLSSL